MDGTIVFIGDSITDGDRMTDPRGLGGCYVEFVADRLAERGDPATIVNTGVSGDRVEHLQQRWQRDALDHRPTVLSIYIGVNDTLVTFFQGRPTSPEAFEARYTDILERAVAAGVSQLIVVEPFFVSTTLDVAPWREGSPFVHEDLALKRPIARKLAERYGAAFIPLQDAMDAAVAERGTMVVARDGVHPSPYGHQLIARLWLQTYDALFAI